MKVLKTSIQRKVKISKERISQPMSKDSYGGYRIECAFCKSRNVIYPPSDQYITILRESCLNNDSFPRTFFCLTCDRLNKIHWDKKHEPSRKQTKGKVSKEQEFAGYKDY